MSRGGLFRRSRAAEIGASSNGSLAHQTRTKEHNADSVKAKVVLELANAPTTPEADRILEDKGILVAPDVLANSGGVTVSCFEWIQGRTGDFWSETEVLRRLDERLSGALRETWTLSEQFRIPLRTAAFVRGVGKVLRAMRLKGIWP